MDKILMILRKDNLISQRDYQDCEFSVDIYDDVIKGLQKIKEENPKIVVIDMAIDRIGAIDLLGIIRSNPKLHHTKVIITSRIYNYNNLKKSFDLGADYYLKYPLNKDEFVKVFKLVKEQSEYSNLENLYKVHICERRKKQKDF